MNQSSKKIDLPDSTRLNADTFFDALNYTDNEDNDDLFLAWQLLRRTSEIVERVRNKELARYGINVRQAAILHLINILGNKATPSTIAKLEMRQPHTVCHIIQTLEKLGLVERRHDLDRRNKVRAILTVKGRQAYEKSKRRDSIRRVMSSLSNSELKQFTFMLKKISQAGKAELRKNKSKRLSEV